MSNETPTSTREFFTAWKLYQDVIAHNYMVHAEVARCLRTWARERGRDGIAVLDLGCGDAHTVRASLVKPLRAVRYTGVDLSAPALQLAAEAFDATDWTATLIEGDLAAAVGSLDERFDLVVAGHALHHLDDATKQRTLSRVRDLLTDAGSVVLYDLLPRQGETRDDYLQRILADGEAEWTELTAEQHASIREHVENFDFPIDYESWRDLAAAAGFAPPELLFRDERQHGVMLLRPAST